MPELLIGLFGALLGVAAVFVAELWKEVVEFRVSARIVRYEIDMNESRLRSRLANHLTGAPIHVGDDTWKMKSSNLAFLLPYEEWRVIARLYAGMHTLPDDIRDSSREYARDVITGVLESMELPQEILKEMDKRSRLALLIDALRGKATAPAMLPIS